MIRLGRIFWMTLLVGALAFPALSLAFSPAGYWDAQVLTTKASAYVEHHGDKVNGVINIMPMFGKKRPYHFNGTMINGIIKASHHDGHHFEGRMLDNDTVEGRITSKDGQSAEIKAYRRK